MAGGKRVREAKRGCGALYGPQTAAENRVKYFLRFSIIFFATACNRRTPEGLVREIMERWGDAELWVSVMSAAELFHGYWRAGHPSQRARREEFVEALLATIPVLPVTLTIARVVGQIDAQLNAAGQRIPASDLLIAATALSRGDAVVTGDARHFDRVAGLTVHHFT